MRAALFDTDGVPIAYLDLHVRARPQSLGHFDPDLTFDRVCHQMARRVVINRCPPFWRRGWWNNLAE